jgi:hypothetical protein
MESKTFGMALKEGLLKKTSTNFVISGTSEYMNPLTSHYLSFAWHIAVCTASCIWKNLFQYPIIILFDKAPHINGLRYCENHRILTI